MPPLIVSFEFLNFLGSGGLTRLIEGIRKQYFVTALPLWDPENVFVPNVTTRNSLTNEIVNMTAMFKPHQECLDPRTVLIKGGERVMGETTYLQKLAFDWDARWQETEDFFKDVKVLLLLKCREAKPHQNLWETISDQLLPDGDKNEETRLEFFKFIRENQSNVLLLLDGLDEVVSDEIQVFSEVIQGKVLPKSYIVATSRYEAGINMGEYFDTLLNIESRYTKDDRREIIRKYLGNRSELAEKLLNILKDEEFEDEESSSLIGMMVNPLATIIMCNIFEDFKGNFPESRTELYVEILQKFYEKKGLTLKGNDLIDHFKEHFQRLGHIALNCLEKGSLDFQKSELGIEEHLELLGDQYGFPALFYRSSRPGRPIRYSFYNKISQQFLAGFYLSSQLLNKERNPETLITDVMYFQQLKEVFLFTAGLVSGKCKETAASLKNSIDTQLSRLQEKDGGLEKLKKKFAIGK